MSVVRIDVSGSGDDFSRQVEVDTDRAVSSFKIDLANREISVNYKRSGSEEPLKLGEMEGVEDEENSGTLLGVVAPVDERASLELDADKVGFDEMPTDEEKAEVKKTASAKRSAAGMKSDPDGNTAKVKTDETKLDS